MRNRFVIGNWKLNGGLSSNAALLNSLKSVFEPAPNKFCGVCVPTPYLAQVKAALGDTAIGWGVQDVSRFESGAYTGDVSAGMAAEFGSRYGIVGHSERRSIFGDTDTMVAVKYGLVKKAGLTPILCLGESLAEREANSTEGVVSRQLVAVIDAYGIQALRGAIVAYEPVWAIGTGKTASPEQAEQVHSFLRHMVNKADPSVGETLPIVYGGSVKKSNAAELFAMANIDGGLIGGASLIAEEFLGIWAAL